MEDIYEEDLYGLSRPFVESYIHTDKHTCRVSVDITPFIKQVIGGTLEEFTSDLKGVEGKVYDLYEAIEKFNEKYKIQIELSIEAYMKMDSEEGS